MSPRPEEETEAQRALSQSPSAGEHRAGVPIHVWLTRRSLTGPSGVGTSLTPYASLSFETSFLPAVENSKEKRKESIR